MKLFSKSYISIDGSKFKAVNNFTLNKLDDLKACLQAGVIPDAYKGFLTDAEKTEIRRIKKMVRYVLHLDQKKMENRKMPVRTPIWYY